MRKPPTVHAVRDVTTSRFLHVEQLDLEFSNGERRIYERMHANGPGAVIIVPMRDDATVLLVREYGAGVGRYELGLPKGRMETGESPEQGANRELQEEIGFGAHRLTVLHHLSLSPSYMTHMAHVVLAQDLYPRKLPGDEPEPLDVTPWPLADLHLLLGREDVTEGRSIAALFMTREYLAGRFQHA
ncbi:MAG: ADP compounds hydrolase NudE [Rhodanobacter sp.]